MPTTNWAGNVAFSTERVHRPDSVAEVQAVVAKAARVRALGTGHSFNRIADSDGELVSVRGLPSSVEIDSAARRARIAAGMAYGEVARQLHASGWALPNLGSLPHISVAGACATGTHGSGDANGVLGTAVCELELVTASGDLVTLRRDDGGDRLRGAVVGLGALGVVTGLTLDLVPTYDVQQVVYEGLPAQAVAEHLDEVLAGGYSVSLFTTWQDGAVAQVWLKRRAERDDGWVPEPSWFGATLATEPRHPITGMSTANSTEQLGVPGPWHERLPHFRHDATPSAGDELQSEYLLPRERALEALHAVAALHEVVAPVLQVSEVRTIAADELWLSPAHGRDSVGVHFTWVLDERAVAPAMAAVEDALEPLDARPHWGKLFGMSPEVVAGRYERLPDFRRLAAELDPTGKFRNAFLEPYLEPAGSA